MIDLSNPDLGMADVELPGGNSVRLDVYEVQNRLHDLSLEYREKPTHEYHAAIVDLMMSLGMPRVSHFLADQFVRQIGEAAKALAGKAESKIASLARSPDSMDSTHLTGQSAN